MTHSPANAAETFDELDPHGFQGHGQHASHVIVGPLTLRSVLAILLFFTVLTVGLAQFEVAIQNAFDIVLPWWVNVAVAMSIAVVKAVLVMAFFMQLKYDNPINTVLMMFTFGALAIFLFFTGLDLFSRGAIDPIKQNQIIAGGTGSQVVGTGEKPLTVAARERLMARLLEKNGGDQAKATAEFERIRIDITSHGHAAHHDEKHLPDANRSVPMLGLSGALGDGHAHHDPHAHPPAEQPHAPAPGAH
jgi:cytochrome c oxidase subunit 4